MWRSIGDGESALTLASLGAYLDAHGFSTDFATLFCVQIGRGRARGGVELNSKSLTARFSGGRSFFSAVA